MPTCVIKGCKNRPGLNSQDSSNKRGHSVTFHRFPVNKRGLMQAWLDSIGIHNMKDQVKVIHSTSIICSEHFEKQYLKFVGQRTRLLQDAIPTVFDIKTQIDSTKTGRWVLAKDSDDMEAILVEDKPKSGTSDGPQNVKKSSEFSISFVKKKPSDPCETICDEERTLSVKRMQTRQKPSPKEKILPQAEDDDASLSCLSPDAISQQVVILPKLQIPKISNEEDKKCASTSLTTRKKKLKIPSTCLRDEHVDTAALDDEESDLDDEVEEKLVIIRAKSQGSLEKKKKLKIPRKIPAEAIKHARKRKTVIISQDEKKNKALALQKTEWHKPREDVICIADMTDMEEEQDNETRIYHLCRICALKGKDMVPIFGTYGRDNGLTEKIHRFLPIEVTEEDRLPLQVCKSCIERLDACEQLANCSHEADLLLRVMLDAEDMDIEVEEMLVPKSAYNEVKNKTEPSKKVPQKEKFICKECKKDFKDFRRFARHCYAVHKRKKCNGCDMFFDSKEELIEHKTQEHGIQCDCCETKFISINAQLAHLRREHPDHKACTCEICGKSFNSKYGLAIHYECHQEDRPFLCDTCGKSFKSKRKLKVHKCISNLSEALPADNTCPECGKVYTLRSSLKRHMLRHNGERRYQCEICSKRFFGSVYLRNHMVIHEKATLYECQMCCARYFHKRNMITHLKAKHSTPWNYKCPSCDQIFQSIDDVVMHHKIHDIENIALGIPQESSIPQGSCLDYQCKICGKTFENIYVLTYHFEEHVIRSQEELNIKVAGTDGGLFECAYCGETMASIWTMKRHVRKAHHEAPAAGVIEYECEYCAKRFTTKSQVRQHLWLHTGEKPFHCQYCDAAFRTQLALKVHTRTHTGEAPYHCQRCPKQFRSAATLRAHQGTHDKPFACPHCGQRFPKKAAYTKHVLLHSSETTQVKRSVIEHKCKHCDYVSRTRSAIKKHEVLHTEPTYFNL